MPPQGAGVDDTWAERLQRARDAYFVGRTEECARFLAFLDSPSQRLLHLWGPGGCGKTTLLHRWASLAAERGLRVAIVDGNVVQPEPEAIQAALPDVGGQPWVFAFDTFDKLRLVETWLRDRLLPTLASTVRVVTSGRLELASHWRMDDGWREMTATLALGGLSDDDASEYLRRRGVPARRIPEAVAFAHGHALSLQLAAELVLGDSERPLGGDVSRSVLKPVLEQYLGRIPSERHRRALHASALVPRTTEAVLEAVLAEPDTRGLFEWLCDLPFMEVREEEGLAPHDLLRDVLTTDLAWRAPDLKREMAARAADYYLGHLAEQGPAELQRALERFVFLLRDTPAGALYHHAGDAPNAYVDVPTPAELPALLALVERHEGPASARIAAHWQLHQRQGLRVLRNADGEPGGFVQHVDIDGEGALCAAAVVDPCFAGLAGVLARAPLRAGEMGRVSRFWMTHEAYQGPSPAQVRIFAHQWQRLCFSPTVSASWMVCADPRWWAARPDRPTKYYPEADFELDGKQFGVFGIDWRRTPRHRQVQRFATLVQGGEPGDPEEIYEVLGAREFRDAVKHALRRYARPDRLCDSPLLGARSVVDRAGPHAETTARVAALRGLLLEASHDLGQPPGTRRHAEVLRLAYLERATKGVAAADELGLPFATYRYYVTEAVRLVCDALWRRELAAASGG